MHCGRCAAHAAHAPFTMFHRRVTGAAGYGSLARGGRVILLREGEDPSQGETYIRLADGSKVVQQPSVRPWWTRMQWFGR